MFREPRELIDDLAACKPDVISTYGSYLDELLPEIRRRGWPGRPPKVALYQADGVSDWVARWARLELGGRRVHAQALRQALRHEPSLMGYQIVQETESLLLVKIVAAPGSDREGLWRRISLRMTAELPSVDSAQPAREPGYRAASA